MKGLYKVVFGFVLYFMIFPVSATHIVGGVMNYQYLGNDNFRIDLSVYRDCKRGIPSLDPYALIWVWNHDIPDTLLTDFFQIPFDSVLDATIQDPCALVQPDECVNWTRYSGVINLPPNNTGYTVYYQRCCRNNSILNITRNPFNGIIEWGSTYSVNIPAGVNGEHVTNSSPVFNNYPPVYICEGKPIDYDHSASDANGDRLIYRLCTPVTGATVLDPVNYFTLEPPPFDTIVWNSPYDLDNMLGGIPLRIDSLTGLMSGTPNTLGQFVVGVSVEEYREGQLLTRTVRDFQFNVVNCGLQVISSFFAPDLQCNSLTVNFDNQSSGADRYYWDFGDGTTSNEEDPTHTYSDTGTYKVSLLSVKGDTCSAAYNKFISIQYKRIEAGFSVNDTACIGPGDLIRFTDQSTDSLNVASWYWTFSNGQVSTQQHPTITYDGTYDSLTATLLVTSVNGCSSAMSRTIYLYRKPAYTLPDILTKCTIENAQIDLDISGNNTFSWSPATGLDDPTAQNPVTNTPVNTTYYVTIRSVLPNGDTCVQQDSVEVRILNTLQINAGDTVSVCNDSVRLSIPLSPGQTVVWSRSPDFDPILSDQPELVVVQTEAQAVYYVKVNADGCQAIDSVTVLFSDTVPQIQLEDALLLCTDVVQVFATVDPYESLQWSTSPTFIPVISTSPFYQTVQAVKTVKYYIRAQYRTCISNDSIQVTIQDTLPVITLADSVSLCSPNGMVSLQATVRNFSSIIWSDSPELFPVIATGRNLNVMQSESVKTYYIRAFYRDCYETDSIVVRLSQTLPQASIIPEPNLFCSDTVSALALASDYTDVSWSTDRSFDPILSDGLSFETIQADSVQRYYFRARNGACEVVDSIVLFQGNIGYTIPGAQVCVGDPVSLDLSVDSDADYQVSWTYSDTSVTSGPPAILSYTPVGSEWVYFELGNSLGCSVADSVFVQVNPLPVVDATVEPDSVAAGQAAQLLAEPDQGLIYQWSPAEWLNDPQLPDPLASPEQTTWFYVYVTDPNGCQGSDSVLVSVFRYACDRSLVFIPNAFSPNGDGVNDVFRVRTDLVTDFKLIVYDRWGTEVFVSSKTVPDWDGQYQGKPVPADAYAFYFEGSCPQGELLVLKGNITILK